MNPITLHTKTWRAPMALSIGRLCTPIFMGLSCASALADLNTHPLEDHYQIAGELLAKPFMGYLSTNTNYASDASNYTPLGLNQYSILYGELPFAFGIVNPLTVFGSVGWKRVGVDHKKMISNQFGFADQNLGLTVRLWQAAGSSTVQKLAIDLQGELNLPAYNNGQSLSKDLPFLGSGTTDAIGSLFFTFPFAKGQKQGWLLQGGIGYLWRSDSFSQGLPWTAKVAYQQASEGVIFEGLLRGIQSLKTDANLGPNPTQSPSMQSIIASGGSFFVNAINPSFINGRVQLGYQLAKPLSFNLYGEKPIWGQASPNFYAFGFTATARFGTPFKKPGAQTPPENGKSNSGFIDYAFEAKVIQANDQLSIVKIDKGTNDNLSNGQTLDIFLINTDGTPGDAIARGHITDLKPTESVMTVDEYYKEVWIEKGFIVKKPLQ